MTGAPPAPAVAAEVFGAALPLAERYAGWLAGPGTVRGLLGPREVDRLWPRHLLNCAVVAPLLDAGDRVVDVGSGAGLPGIVLALLRPDCAVTLLEPLARRAAYLAEVVADLDLPVAVVRERAEDHARSDPAYDVATARAVAPLGQLATWCLPLLRPGGRLLAFKGDRATAEVAEVPALGAEVRQCGAGLVDPPTTVVSIVRPRRSSRR